MLEHRANRSGRRDLLIGRRSELIHEIQAKLGRISCESRIFLRIYIWHHFIGSLGAFLCGRREPREHKDLDD